LGLGYGYLGLVGPQNIDTGLIEKVEIVHHKFSHTGWFNKDNFDNTMRKVTGAAV
jgi:hypothetical protein